MPEFTRIGIDDGDSEIFGSGNANKIAEPGETVMIYVIFNGSRRSDSIMMIPGLTLSGCMTKSSLTNGEMAILYHLLSIFQKNALQDIR